MLKYFIILIILAHISIAACRGKHRKRDNLIVTSPMGKFQGSIIKSRLGKDIYSFRGIRYAEPPINDLRFKPPVPIEKYEGIYNATVDGPICPQPPFSAPISEDCLMLNVYSTKLPSGGHNTKRPVIIHLHAGGFYSGTERSNWGGPQYFMDQDIVLVLINYRLGSLGFLSTGDKYAPGNNGLKDQVVVLKWVQKNIEAFGGDPNAVTLMGYSAGSWSVILHMISPMSKGLFHRAVASSGSGIGIWPVPKSQPHLAKKQAKLLGCPDDTSEHIINCLKTKPAEDLGNSLLQFFEFEYNPILIWSYVIEDDFGQERFMPDHPVNLINAGHLMDIPFIAGVTTDEFAGPAVTIINNETLLSTLDKEWNKYAPICFIYERDTEKSKTVSEASRKFYLGDGPLSNSSLQGLANMFADGVIGYSVYRTTKLISEKNTKPVYYYKFSYQGRYSHFNLPGTETPYGVVHHDDLIYLFYISTLFPYFNSTYPEAKTVETLTGIYGNFAKTGNPSYGKVTWEPYNTKTQKYLDIGENLVLKEKLYEDRYKFWEKYYPIDQV